jgi:hypothetical protein
MPVSFSTYFKLKWLGYSKIYVETKQLEGWSAPMEIYLSLCSLHGFYLSYIRGRDSLFCVGCRDELPKLIKKYTPTISKNRSKNLRI